MDANLSERFEDALVFTTRLHRMQFRKGTQIPYVSHLLSVAALVLEAGGDEELAIAALLHDAVEDQGGLETLEEIRNRYGGRVARIVESCSDAFEVPKPAWRNRKEEYIAHLQSSSEDARLVSVADKLHNARSILRDILVNGDDVWSKFNGGKDGTLWYYRSLVLVFEALDQNFLVDELRRVVEQIENLVIIK
jgi:(p)ppGpp synthase/HD superfamily hydrolase